MMTRFALFCALITAVSPAWAGQRLITHKDIQAEEVSDLALAYHVNHKVSQMAPGETPLEDLQEDTGCNARGAGPAKFGCDIYQAEGRRNSYKNLTVRGGVNQSQVGVGINVTW